MTNPLNRREDINSDVMMVEDSPFQKHRLTMSDCMIVLNITKRLGKAVVEEGSAQK